MNDPIYGLSRDDVLFLKEQIGYLKQLRINSQIREPVVDTYNAPETYIALPEQCQGILGLTRYTGTGTAGDPPGTAGHKTGTGTSSCLTSAHEWDIPGSGLCDIYKIRASDGKLEKVGNSVTVWNLSESDIAKDWIVVTRDKFGRWVPLTPGGSVRVIFQIISLDCANGVALCEVIYVSQGGGSVKPGQVIKVCDLCGTFFIGSYNILIGAMGWAEQFQGYKCKGPDTGTSTSTYSHPFDLAPDSSWIVYQMCGTGVTC